MFRSIRWRISVPFAVIIILAMLTLGGILSVQGRRFLIEKTQERLFAETQLLAGLLEDQPFTEENAPSLDALARSWSADLGVRVTLIDSQGRVLGESDEDRSLMDNHAGRPEVIGARTAGQGSSIRFSSTLGLDIIYVALPHSLSGGVIRLSIPLDRVDSDIAALNRVIYIATAIAAVLVLAVAVVVSGRTTRPLMELTAASRRISAGELGTRLAPTSRDEVGELAHALNRMSLRLRNQIDALDAEREKLAAILQQMSSGVVLVDEEGSIVLFNRAVEEIFGILESQAVNRSLVETFRHFRIVEAWQSARRDHEVQILNLELPHRSKSLQLIAAPLRGVLTGNTLLIFQDLTRLRQLETIRQDFISNISHELRTPLASLKALTETLLDSALDDPPAARHFLSRIEIEVDSLSLMVLELLELSRIESGRVPLEFKTVRPGDLVEMAVERLLLQAERGGIEVVVDVAPDLPSVRADPPRLQQVLMNLLHNAIKFTPSGGRIEIGARQSGGDPSAAGPERIEFRVCDTGVGIPADDLPRIFERFYKADRARSGGGTGLGLAIARHLVEAHRGKIWAESRFGQGSQFFFSIPISRA